MNETSALPAIVAAIVDDIAKELRVEFGAGYRGLIVVGSYARGDWHEESDIDLDAVTFGSAIVQREFTSGGHPVQLTITPRRYLERAVQRNPFACERFASGTIVDDVGEDLHLLQLGARAAFPLPRPSIDAFAAVHYVHRLRTVLKDAKVATDTDALRFIHAYAVQVAFEALLAVARVWKTKPREALRTLDRLDPEGAAAIRNVLAGCADPSDREALFTLIRYVESRLGHTPAASSFSKRIAFD
jgi:hypothetical protein